MAARGSLQYQKIENWLREMCRAGSPGDLLPSEAEIAERFQVSRMTVRQAIANLEYDGLVDRIRGSGTYIANRPMHRREGVLLSFTEDMHLRGLAPSSRVLSAGPAHATKSDAEALGIDEGDPVVRVSRIRLANATPVALERVTLPITLSAVLEHDLQDESLHMILRNLGRGPAGAWSWVTARLAKSSESRELDIAPRSALLVERRVVLDRDDVPVEHSETAYVASRYVIDLGLQAAGLSARSRAQSAAPTAPAKTPKAAGRTSKKAGSTKQARRRSSSRTLGKR